MPSPVWIVALVIVVCFLFALVHSTHRIGPTEVGLVTKRFSWKKLAKDNPVAFEGEAGYQAELLMPGLRWKSWLLYSVEKYSWVQVPAGQIGVVIAQVGAPLPIGAKSAVYKREFANFSDLKTFIQGGGQKGVQRPVLPPGTLIPIHPVAFLVATRNQVYGLPVSPEIREKIGRNEQLSPGALGLDPSQLELMRIEPRPKSKDGDRVDVIGIVTTYEGDPLPSGDIASRLGGFADMTTMEKGEATDAEITEAFLAARTNCTTTTRTFRRFSIEGARSACSMIRCSMEHTH